MQKQRCHKTEATRLELRQCIGRVLSLTRQTQRSFAYKTRVTPGDIFKVLHRNQAYSPVSPRRRKSVKEGDCTPRMTVAGRKIVWSLNNGYVFISYLLDDFW